MQKRHDRSHLWVAAFVSMTLLAAGKGAKDYRDEALKVTKEVETFVARECIKGSDVEKVHKIIEVAHNKFLFPSVDRNRMETWLQNPDKAEEFSNSLEKQKTDLRRLYEKRITHLLSAEEDKQRQELQQAVFIGEHDLRVFNEVIRKKDISPLDIPFAVSGAEAVVYGITDGCTTAAKTFIVLAQAAGLKETRYVATGNVSDYNLACISKGQPRRPEITINGHFFALVKIGGRWALVNCTYYNPYSEEDEIRYEIFFNLDGQEVNPDMLKLRILRIPSFQRDAGGTLSPPPNRLYVIAVGKDSQDDLDIENYNALMNLSVSGDRNCPECKYNRF